MVDMKDHNSRMKKVFNDYSCSACHGYIGTSDRWAIDHPYVILCEDVDTKELLGAGVHRECIEEGICPKCKEKLDPKRKREWEDLVYHPDDKSIYHRVCSIKMKRVKTKW